MQQKRNKENKKIFRWIVDFLTKSDQKDGSGKMKWSDLFNPGKMANFFILLTILFCAGIFVIIFKIFFAKLITKFEQSEERKKEE